MHPIYDCIVVGSGPSGVQAAQTLLEGKMNVLMLDVGIKQDRFYQDLLPANNFTELRESDPNQHNYFLGKNLESVAKDWHNKQDRLTPPLAFTKELVDLWQTKMAKESSQNFMESLAKGGLGNAWGRGAFTFNERELDKVGLSPVEMTPAYHTIAQRIGISGTQGQGANLSTLLPPLFLDKSMRYLWNMYVQKRAHWERKGFALERTPLAVQSIPKKGRQDEKYWDIDFWSLGKSAGYHPGHTLDQLLQKESFTYLSQHYVFKFKDQVDGVRVTAKHTGSLEEKTFYCKRLLLCASVLGTARIVLNSLGAQGQKRPLICNPFAYGIWLNTKMFGQQNSIEKSSFSQLSLFERAPDATSFHLLNLYTYRSLLLTKLIKELPFSYRFSYQIFAIIKEMLVIGGLHLPEERHSQNYIRLLPDEASPTGHILDINYQHDDKPLKKAIRSVNKPLFKWGAIPIMTKYTASGSSKHYGGTFPFSTTAKEFCLSTDGRLHHTRHVYIGDASGFKYLPAKGPTLTIMAHAHHVAKGLVKERNKPLNLKTFSKKEEG